MKCWWLIGALVLAGCAEELALPATDGDAGEADSGRAPSPPDFGEPVPSKVWLGPETPIRIGDLEISGTVKAASCAYERCLVVYSEYVRRGGVLDDFSFGLFLRRPDGAVVGGPVELDQCFGPAASDGQGFAVLCPDGLIRLWPDGRTRRIASGATGDQIIFHDDGYLIAVTSEGADESNLRILSLGIAQDAELQPTGCCELPLGDGPFLDGPVYRFVSAEQPVVVVNHWPAESPPIEFWALSVSGAEVRRRIGFSEWGTEALTYLTSAASAGKKVMFAAFPLEGLTSAFLLDPGTGTVTRVCDRFGYSRILPVDDSYYLAIGTRHRTGFITRPGLERITREGVSVGDEAIDLDLDGWELLPLNGQRFAAVSSGLDMRIIEYEAADVGADAVRSCE